MLRALQVGLRLDDLDQLEVGQVIDLCTEMGNDHEHYDTRATQDDFDRF